MIVDDGGHSGDTGGAHNLSGIIEGRMDARRGKRLRYIQVQYDYLLTTSCDVNTNTPPQHIVRRREKRSSNTNKWTRVK